MKKIIGVTARNNRIFEADIYNVYKDYFQAILSAGAIPIMLPEADREDLSQVLKMLDGVLVAGGNDINPSLYEEDLTFSMDVASITEDKNDLTIIDLCIEKGIPILGICKGLQLINVYFGGSLYQDLQKDKVTEKNHNQDHLKHPKNAMLYQAYFLKNNFFYDIFGPSSPINSFHHQAIKDLGQGIEVCGYSDDKIIESIAYPSKKIYAVQWHPEHLIYDSRQLQVFQKFIEEIC